MENYKPYQLYSKTNYYKYITGIWFVPVKEISVLGYIVKKLHNKGDEIKKKLFGITISKKECVSDVYEITTPAGLKCIGDVDFIIRELPNISSIRRFFFSEGNFYKMAEVFVTESYSFTKSDKNYFFSNEDAQAFVDDIKKKCEEVGNMMEL